MLNVNKILKPCVPSLRTKNYKDYIILKHMVMPTKILINDTEKQILNSRNGNISFADAF